MATEYASVSGTPSASDPALTEIVRRLVDAYRPERVYLFGSVARGDAGPDSDYDILVVVADRAPAERRRSRLADEVLWGTGVAADVLVSTASQFEGREHLAASLPATVIREGKLLHAACPGTARGGARVAIRAMPRRPHWESGMTRGADPTVRA